MSVSLANKITFLRILLVPVFIIALLYYSPERDFLRLVALGIFVLASLSDVADGYLARSRNERTPLGMILDPLADKVLLISSFVCLTRMGAGYWEFRIPPWLAVAAISRDVILIVGSSLLIVQQGHLGMEATRWGKFSTLSQVVTIIGVLMQWNWTRFLWPVVIFVGGVSAFDYLRKGARLLNSGMRG